MRVATTGAPHAIASRIDCPNGSSSDGAADDVGGGEPARHRRRAGRGRRRARRARPSSAAAQRPVADERERAAAEPRERVGEPHDVLALGQRPDVRRTPATRAPPRAPRRAKRSRSTPESTTSVLPRASGSLRSSSRRRYSETRDHRRRAAYDAPRQRRDARHRADVADVAAVRGDDERRVHLDANSPDGTRKCAQTTSGRRGRADTACRSSRKRALAAAAPVEHRELDLVPALAQRVLQLRDERAEVGVGRPRVHLRDEQDPHQSPSARRAGGRTRPTPRAGRRRSRRPCSARAARRASDGAGCRCRAPRSRTRVERRGRFRRVPLGAHVRGSLDLAPLGLRVDPAAARSAAPRPRRSALTPTIGRSPDSTCCCQRYAAASISPWTKPCSTAATAPPSSSTRSISSQARASSSSVSASM